MRNTSAAGASNVRWIRSSLSAMGRDSVLVAIFGPRQVFQQDVHLVEAALPEAAVEGEPLVDLLERGRVERAWPPLGFLATRDQAGRFQHLQMTGNRLQGDIERLGQLVHRGLALGQARQK